MSFEGIGVGNNNLLACQSMPLYPEERRGDLHAQASGDLGDSEDSDSEQELSQKELQGRYAGFCAFCENRGQNQAIVPRLPTELVYKILSFIPSITPLATSESTYKCIVKICIYGLLPHAIFNPTLLRPYYTNQFSADWTLKNLDRQQLKTAALSDVSLMRSVTLSVLGHAGQAALEKLATYLQHIEAPHLCNLRLLVEADAFSIDTFANLLKSWHSRIVELRINMCSLMSTCDILIECSSLKTLKLCFEAFPAINSSIRFNSVTNLTVDFNWSRGLITVDKINNLARTLSQLACLEELNMHGFDGACKKLKGLSKVKSASLRSLKLDGGGAHLFFPLFSDCYIVRIDVESCYITESEKFFPHVRDIRTYLPPIPESLYKPKQSGGLAFPLLENLELKKRRFEPYDMYIPVKDVQTDLLQTVRARARDAIARPVRHLRLSKEIVSDMLFQEELEKYIPSLVLLASD